MSKITEDQRTLIADAYEDVRNDQTETKWLTCGIEGKEIVLGKTGIDYEDLLPEFADDTRLFAFVRMTMGDELSKRAKFAFIQWTGQDSSVMQRAKMSPAKTEVKRIITSFAAEIMGEHKSEVSLDAIRDKLQKAGGANYGTGQRD